MKIKTLKENDPFYSDLELRIDSIKHRKQMYTIFYRSIKVFVFIAGALITILTGWKSCCPDPSQTENFVLILSSTVAFFAAIEGLFSFRDKGKSYDYFLFDLRRLRDRISFEYMESPELYSKNRHTHFEDYQGILQSQRSIIEISETTEN